jgi:hypothetical protein
MGWKKKLVKVYGTSTITLPENYKDAVLLSVDSGTITSYREIYNGGPDPLNAVTVGAQSVKITTTTETVPKLYPKLEIITSGPATLEIIVYG